MDWRGDVTKAIPFVTTQPFPQKLDKYSCKIYMATMSYSLFIYQDENEDENQSFRSFLYVLKQTCDERI